MVNTKLYKRRLRMMRLLAAGSSLNLVVTAVASEFGCNEATIYRDYANMYRWAKDFNQDEQIVFLLLTRLEMLNRDALDTIHDEGEKNPCVRIGAINSSLKITKEQLKNAKNRGLYDSKPAEVTQTFPTTMPFEALPEIREAYRRCAEARKAEKDKEAAANTDRP